MTNCTTCAVAQGYKPAEALQQIGEPKQDAVTSVWEAIGYQCALAASSGELAPSQKLLDAMKSVEAEIADAHERIAELETKEVNIEEFRVLVTEATRAPLLKRVRELEAELAAVKTAPTPQEQDVQDAELRQQSIGAAIERVCKELPEGAGIVILLERGSGSVEMVDWDGNEFDHFDEIEDFAERINAATDGAIASSVAIAASAKGGE